MLYKNKYYHSINIYFFLCFAFLIILNVFHESNKFEYISKKNSLCYSWIPNNKYIKGSQLCSLNCSYVRTKMYPLNKPFTCYKNKSITSHKTSYYAYVFNTSTYNKFVSQYRFFYGNKTVILYM